MLLEEINSSSSKELEAMNERIAENENRSKEVNIRSNENEHFSRKKQHPSYGCPWKQACDDTWTLTKSQWALKEIKSL